MVQVVGERRRVLGETDVRRGVGLREVGTGVGEGVGGPAGRGDRGHVAVGVVPEAHDPQVRQGLCLHTAGRVVGEQDLAVRRVGHLRQEAGRRIVGVGLRPGALGEGLEPPARLVAVGHGGKAGQGGLSHPTEEVERRGALAALGAGRGGRAGPVVGEEDRRSAVGGDGRGDAGDVVRIAGAQRRVDQFHAPRDCGASRQPARRRHFEVGERRHQSAEPRMLGGAGRDDQPSRLGGSDPARHVTGRGRDQPGAVRGRPGRPPSAGPLAPVHRGTPHRGAPGDFQVGNQPGLPRIGGADQLLVTACRVRVAHETTERVVLEAVRPRSRVDEPVQQPPGRVGQAHRFESGVLDRRQVTVGVKGQLGAVTERADDRLRGSIRGPLDLHHVAERVGHGDEQAAAVVVLVAEGEEDDPRVRRAGLEVATFCVEDVDRRAVRRWHLVSGRRDLRQGGAQPPQAAVVGVRHDQVAVGQGRQAVQAPRGWSAVRSCRRRCPPCRRFPRRFR